MVSDVDPLESDDWGLARSRARRERARERERRQLEDAERERTLPKPERTRSHWARVLTIPVLVLAVATAAGLIALWPGSEHHRGPSQAFGGKTVGASVTAVRDIRCPGPTAQRCRQLEIKVGARTAPLTLGPANIAPHVEKGDAIRVQPVAAPPGARHVEPYEFAGLDRRGTLLWLLLGFAALVVVMTRWRGLLALAGFALSLFLVTRFIVPAIAQGSSPVLVALV